MGGLWGEVFKAPLCASCPAWHLQSPFFGGENPVPSPAPSLGGQGWAPSAMPHSSRPGARRPEGPDGIHPVRHRGRGGVDASGAVPAVGESGGKNTDFNKWKWSGGLHPAGGRSATLIPTAAFFLFSAVQPCAQGGQVLLRRQGERTSLLSLFLSCFLGVISSVSLGFSEPLSRGMMHVEIAAQKSG